MHAPSSENSGRVIIPDGTDSAVQEVPAGDYAFRPDWPCYIAFFSTNAEATAATLDKTAVRPWPPGGPAAPPAGQGRTLGGDATYYITVPEGLRFFRFTASISPPTPPPESYLEWGPA